MRTFGLIAVFLFAVLSGRSQTTLREQLQDARIPSNHFSEAELNEVVDGTHDSKNQNIYFVYLRTKGDSLTGLPQVVRYNMKDNMLLRAEIKPEDANICCGSPEGIDFIDDYLLLTFHVNPSAASVVVLDSKLRVVQTLYGFGIERVAPNQVVFTGSMVHFAPTHAERLMCADLRNGKTTELYPSGNDVLRTAFIGEHRKRMPSEAVCKQPENDPCDPDMFDEDVTFLGSDGNGRFAIVVDRDAFHAPAKNQAPVSVLSESVLYIYAHGVKGWVYCEQKISESDSTSFNRSSDRNLYPSVRDRCIPDVPIVPDRSN
jgi:hypothetical protein